MQKTSGVSTAIVAVALVLIVGVAGVAYYAFIASAPKGTTTSQSSSGSGSTTTPTVDVGMGNGASGPFTPQTITVVIGVNNTIRWTNNDSEGHTVTSNTAGLFDSGNLNPSQTFTRAFSTPGTYSYHCSYHSAMTGTIIVKSP